MENDKPEKRQSIFDRRCGEDRRNAYNMDYFLEGGVERRNSAAGERRMIKKERRRDWIKISRWCSLHVEGKNEKPCPEEGPLDIE